MTISYSHIQSYRACPRRYEYAFKKKLTMPLTAETCFGVSMHLAMAKWGKLEIEENAQIRKCANTKMQSSMFEEEKGHVTCDMRLETLLCYWSDSFVLQGYDTTAAAEFDRKRGEILMEKFFEWWEGETRVVVGVEKGFKCNMSSRVGRIEAQERRVRPYRGIDQEPLDTHLLGSEEPRYGATRGDIVISGRFDRVEEKSDGTLRIIDFKTGGLRSQETVEGDLQLSLYAIAAKEVWAKSVSELVMLFLVDEDVTEIVTKRTEGELNTAAKTITLISERIESKDYRPTPSFAKCRGCPFRRVCDVSAVGQNR